MILLLSNILNQLICEMTQTYGLITHTHTHTLTLMPIRDATIQSSAVCFEIVIVVVVSIDDVVVVVLYIINPYILLSS